MCLARAYVRGASEAGAAGGKSATGVDEDRLLMENVTQVDVDGDQIRVRSLLGGTELVRGRVASIDFSEGRLVLQSAEA